MLDFGGKGLEAFLGTGLPYFDGLVKSHTTLSGTIKGI